MKFVKSKLCLLLILPFLSCVGTDKDLTPEERDQAFQQKIQLLTKFADMAKEHNMALSANLHYGGTPGVGQQLKFFLDTDVSLEINVHANPGSASK